MQWLQSVRLKSSNAAQRLRVVEDLCQGANAKRVTLLLAAARDEDGEVRTAAIRGLGSAGDPRAVAGLVEALGDAQPGVRAQAALALGKTHDPLVAEFIIPMLQDRDTDVRRAAAQALGLLRDPCVLESLIEALADRERTVREAACQALESIDPSWENSEAAQTAIPRLEAAVNAPEYWVRVAATEALARIHGQVIEVPPEEILQKPADTRFLPRERYA